MPIVAMSTMRRDAERSRLMTNTSVNPLMSVPAARATNRASQ